MFNTDIKALSSLSSDETYVSLLREIISFGKDLNNLTNKRLYSEFKHGSHFIHKDLLKSIFLKLVQSKVFFINLLKETISLCPFKYFKHSSFLDTRRRYYNTAVFTSIQNFPLSNMLVTLYEPSLTISKEELKEKIICSIKDDKIRDELRKHLKSDEQNTKAQGKKGKLHIYIENLAKNLSNVSGEQIKDIYKEAFDKNWIMKLFSTFS